MGEQRRIDGLRPGGTCEKIEIASFLGGGKCLRSSRTPLISDLNDKFVPANLLRITKIIFSQLPVPGFPRQDGLRLRSDQIRISRQVLGTCVQSCSELIRAHSVHLETVDPDLRGTTTN